MDDGHLAVSLVSEIAEERVPCRETRTGLEKLASGITEAVRKTRNSSGRRATGRTISRAASDLNSASNPADETTVMPTFLANLVFRLTGAAMQQVDGNGRDK